MHTIERIAQAKTIVGTANVVYLGTTEFESVRLGMVEQYAPDDLKMIMGLTIVRVRLDSYLQVAYAEGVK